MSALKTAKLRVKIVKIGLTGRLLILASIFLFKENGYFRHDTFRELLCIMLPLASFYITLFVRFIFKVAYQYPGAGVDTGKDQVGFGYYGLLFLNIAELSFILYSALSAGGIQPLFADNFIFYILTAELAFGIIAGIYIAELFGTNHKNNVS